MEEPVTVEIMYCNHRGETQLRRVVPKCVYFGQTKWYTKRQWLLSAIDTEDGREKDFAMQNIRAWLPNS